MIIYLHSKKGVVGLIEEFNNKFEELNEANKKYVLAVSQALLFAQSNIQIVVDEEEVKQSA